MVIISLQTPDGPHQPRGVRGHGRPVRQQPRARADGARQPVRRGRAVHGLHEVGPEQNHVSRGVTRRHAVSRGSCHVSPGYGGLDVADRLRHGLIHLHLLRDELAAFLSNRGEHVDCNIDITDIHLLSISNICTVSTHTGCEISVRSVQTLPVS